MITEFQSNFNLQVVSFNLPINQCNTELVQDEACENELVYPQLESVNENKTSMTLKAYTKMMIGKKMKQKYQSRLHKLC